MTLHCIIVDDEEIARKGVEKYIAGIPFLEIEGGFDAAAPALASMKDKRIDLIFLDISPDLNCSGQFPIRHWSLLPQPTPTMRSRVFYWKWSIIW
jgi:DNA-binding NarL/FixJ family response regulator